MSATHFVFANGASSLLASAILSTDTSCTVTATQGALFPAISSGQTAICTIEDTSGNIEVIYATARSTDTLTIVRAQEGTSAQGFASGSRIEQRVTAGLLNSLLQKQGGDTIAAAALSGVLAVGSGGSIQGGEYVGKLRGVAGQTSNQIAVPSSGPATSGGSVILTAANIAAQLTSGTAIIQSQMIVGWAGILADIPTGWLICDGTHGTPDLTDQFIVGATAGSALASTGTYASTTGSTASTGTTDGYALQLGDLISHVHPFDYFTSAPSVFIGIPGFSGPGNSPAASAVAGSRTSFAGSANTGHGTNAHTHTFTGTAHTHSVSAPPYTALFFIMKS